MADLRQAFMQPMEDVHRRAAETMHEKDELQLKLVEMASLLKRKGTPEATEMAAKIMTKVKENEKHQIAAHEAFPKMLKQHEDRLHDLFDPDKMDPFWYKSMADQAYTLTLKENGATKAGAAAFADGIALASDASPEGQQKFNEYLSGDGLLDIAKKTMTERKPMTNEKIVELCKSMQVELTPAQKQAMLESSSLIELSPEQRQAMQERMGGMLKDIGAVFQKGHAKFMQQELADKKLATDVEQQGLPAADGVVPDFQASADNNLRTSM